MKTEVYNIKGEKTGEIEISNEIFGLKPNKDLMHQVVRFFALNKKFPVAHAKDRSEVSGGGRKPWKQKGTGRARHGSTRSPIWRTGGVTFGPLSWNNHQVSINKKMKKKALLMGLSEAYTQKELKFVDKLSLSDITTKEANKILSNLIDSYCEGDHRVLLVIPSKNEVLEKSFRNIEKVNLLRADSLNLEDILKSQRIIVDVESLDIIDKIYRV
jgi:large subunit ribosomal protein L4